MNYLITPNKYPFHKGGVPYYNHLLEKYLNVKLVTLQDCFVDGKNEIDLATNLNKKAKSFIPKGSTIIGDGIWGNVGFNSDEYRLVSLCHGLWSRAVGLGSSLSETQKKGYQRSEIVVACSRFSQLCITQDYHCESNLIPTMVEPDIWKEETQQREGVLLLKKNGWGINHWNDLVEKNFPTIIMDTYEDKKLVELYSKARCFVHLTAYEGNSFAVLKALSCNCPVVSTGVGLFGELSSGFHKVGVWVCDKEGDVKDGVDFFTTHSCNTDKSICNDFKRFVEQWKKILE